ncbi:hypothetical protein DM860_009338 [Cuscuta australis]|uniref:Retrotransposon Copia-like N-terminal domain-containing protein n=1 Tax=Cuscuta australis TaxID=267555 RepID=A0A328DF27_9ASTE|nr:hypothetical protein DM860_009338 [Cuscuta australis]
MSASKHFPIKLTKTNFLVWRHQVQSTLIGLNLLGYVDGSVKAPCPFLDSAHTQPNPAYTLRYRQDAILLSAILGSCTDVVQSIVSLADTSADAWSRLAMSLASRSRGRIISLKAKLAKKPRGNRTIAACVADMTEIAGELALADSPVSDEDLAVHIMSQLGDEYSTIYQSLRGHNDCVSIEELTAILEDCERHLREHASATADLVPTANHTQRARSDRHGDRGDRGGVFHWAGGFGQSRGGHHVCGSSLGGNRGGRYCRFCDLASHDTWFFRKLQRFLRENNVTITTPNTNNPTAHVTVSNGDLAQSNTQWIVDSGASHHVATDPNSLNTLMEIEGPDEIHLGNGCAYGDTSASGSNKKLLILSSQFIQSVREYRVCFRFFSG